MLPNEEDLEKIKITLNWLIKNRNSVRAFYLKDYQTKDELFSVTSNGNDSAKFNSIDYYNINQLVNVDSLS
jgi:hypothetical protein